MNGSPITTLVKAARKFVGSFFADTDQLGLVVFGGGAIVAYPMRDPTAEDGGGLGPDGNFKVGGTAANPNMDFLISKITSGGATGTAEAVWLAYKELKKNEQPLYLNLIVLFTDGMPNGFTAYFNDPAGSVVKSTAPCTYKTATSDLTTRMIGWYANSNNFNPNTGDSLGVCKVMQRAKFGGSTTRASDVEGWLGATSSQGQQERQPVALPASDKCDWKTDERQVGTDMTRIPDKDYYGNQLVSNDYLKSRHYHDHTTSQNYTKVDDDYQVGIASWNAALDAARRARADISLKPVIFTLGYNGSNAIDKGLLKRMANTNQLADFLDWDKEPQGSYLLADYDPASTAGRYFEAPDESSIDVVFGLVQREILRLTR
jgi:hypothetical protein